MENINSNYINGPIISVRMEGKIGNVNKIIYLYGDIHYPSNKQTACRNLNAKISGISFINYIKHNLNANNDNIDLFFELGPLYKRVILPLKNKKHIDEIAHFFIKSINVKNNKNLGTIINNKKKNLRLHYVDYRDLLKNKFNIIFDKIKNEIFSSCDNMYIIEMLNLLKQEYKNTVSIFLSQPTTNSNDIIYKIAHKIFNKYNNDNVKNILVNKFMINKINELYHLCNEEIDYFIKNIGTFNNISLYIKQLIKIDKLSFKTYSYIIDAFFLRRFLDKDYITKGVVYMGVYHILFYLHILINDFNFKVSHVSNNSVDINTLVYLIKNKFTDNTINKIIAKNNIQCSDISNFPKNFS